MNEFGRFMNDLTRSMDQVKNAMNQVQSIYKEVRKISPLFKEISGPMPPRATTFAKRTGKESIRNRKVKTKQSKRARLSANNEM